MSCEPCQPDELGAAQLPLQLRTAVITLCLRPRHGCCQHRWCFHAIHTFLSSPASPSYARHLVQYEPEEPVVIWLSKVGPYHNPQETYTFYSLPYCRPAKALSPETRLGGLGEILEGAELQNSDMRVTFRSTSSLSVQCVNGFAAGDSQAPSRLPDLVGCHIYIFMSHVCRKCQ